MKSKNNRRPKRKNKSFEKRKDLFDISSGKELLVALLIVGGVLTVLSIQPALLAAAIPMAKMMGTDSREKRKFQHAFQYLKRKDLISIEKHGDRITIKVTPPGIARARVAYFSTNASLPPKPVTWDGQWRIIIFDIPYDEREKRDALRYLVKRIGAVMLQQSVWAYPYDCFQQVAFLKEFFNLTETNVRCIIARDIGDDRLLRQQFGL